MSITFGSGAAESVASPEAFPGYPVKPHPKPILYQSATGEPIVNRGEQQIAMVTSEGALRGMRFQATDKVNKPLASVATIAEAGHDVIFAPAIMG